MKTGRYIAKVPGINIYNVEKEPKITRELKLNEELVIVRIEEKKFPEDASCTLGWLNEHEYVILKSKFGELNIEFMEKKKRGKKDEVQK